MNFKNKKPQPNSQYFIDYLLGKAVGKPPLVEYLVDDVVMRPIVTHILDRDWFNFTNDRENQVKYLDNFIQFWYFLGYDFVRFEQNAGFPTPQVPLPDTAKNSHKIRMWAEQHKGFIESWEEFEKYPFPDIKRFDFFAYEYLNRNMPEGMGLIVSHAAGVFEHLSQIMSYEGLCIAIHDQPLLVKTLADEIGSRIEEFYRQLLDLDRIIALFPGDDLGFRTGTLVSPGHLREFVLPWHRKFAALAHSKDLPYFLHSCGNLSSIMEDLIEDVKIDGKHSFEDAIKPVELFHEIYHPRIAALGGVDINILANGTPETVRKKVRRLVELCGSRGRYALGSGNSIPSYIPVENYIAMVDEARA
jgi:uroporphyrinogen decarboxylase